MLKAYISGALMGASSLEQARGLYHQFADACEGAGWEPYLPHNRTDPERNQDVTPSAVFDDDIGALERADVVIAYLGEPSLGVGAELVLAMHAGKPILALFESSRRVSRFARGLLQRYPNARMHAFESTEDAMHWIDSELRSSVATVGAGASLMPQSHAM